MGEEIKTEEIDLGEVETYESKGIDLTKFEGKKAKVEKAFLTEVPSFYDEDGKPMPKGAEPRIVKVLKIVSDVVTTVQNEDGQDIEVRASELFNCKEEDGKIKIPDHPKAKIQKFMKKLKVSSLKEVIGEDVTLKAVENKNGQTFLGFVY